MCYFSVDVRICMHMCMFVRDKKRNTISMWEKRSSTSQTLFSGVFSFFDLLLNLWMRTATSWSLFLFHLFSRSKRRLKISLPFISITIATYEGDWAERMRVKVTQLIEISCFSPKHKPAQKYPHIKFLLFETDLYLLGPEIS